MEGVARQLARAEFPDLALVLDSAGTASYHIGDAPDPRTQRAAALRGYDLSTLRARQVSRADFEHFDLLLAMDEQDLEEMQSLAPARRRDRARLFLSYAPQLELIAVPDPYYGGPEGFETVLNLAEQGCRSLFLSIAAQVGR
ncbi:MAG: low molecular weight protein-tyrosine-phosphatase [Pseudomonadota bacterium]